MSSDAESSTLASSSAVHARIVVRPIRDCPVTRLAANYGLRDLVAPGHDDRAPQAIVDAAPDDGLVRAGAHPVVRAGDATVCRVPSLQAGPEGDVTTCMHDHCLAHGYGFLPIDPYRTRWEGDALHCSFAAIDTREIEHVVQRFGRADFLVELDQLIRADGGDAPEGVAVADETTVMNLDALTDRQREIAGIAVDRGYFARDGPSAEEVADELGIAKATLSEHLRAVQRELVSQAFDGK